MMNLKNIDLWRFKMSENMNYKINFDEIASDFKYKEGGGLTHSQGNRYK